MSEPRTLYVTANQRQVLLALGSSDKSAREVSDDLLITESAARGRLFSLWKKGLVDRTWRHGRDRWFVTGQGRVALGGTDHEVRQAQLETIHPDPCRYETEYKP